MKRGEVWWAELPPPAGRRPVLLLSRDDAYEVRALVTVAPVTTRIRHIASEVPLGPAEGLPRDCAVTLDTIETFPKSLLDERITALGSEMAEAVDEAIRFALDLGPAG